MEQVTIPTLRPLRFGELFDQAFRIYRRNFLTFVGIIAIVYIPYVVLQSASSGLFLLNMETTRSANLLTSLSYWLFILSSQVGTVLYSIFVDGLGTAAITHATARRYLNQNISIIGAYRQLGTSWLHLLFAMLIFNIITSFVSVWMIIPIVGWFTGVGAILFLSGVVGTLLPSITTIEKKTWIDPIPRAWNLARRRFWWLLAVTAIFGIFTMIVSIGPTMLIGAIMAALIGSAPDLIALSTLISSALAGLVTLFVLPILSIARTLIYFDLRIRTEGLDLALATLDLAENEQIELAKIEIPPTKQPWLTWDDITKFAILSLGLLGIIALIVGLGAILVVVFDAAL